MSQEEKKKSIGGLWVRTAASGTEYMSGSIEINGEKVNFTAFRNSYKEDGDKKPDWTLQPSQPRQEQAQAAPAPVRKPPVTGAAPKQTARGVAPAPTRAPIPQRGQQAAPARKPAPRAPEPVDDGYVDGDDENIPF